jgi:class 3 adenylate cyclase
MDNSSAIPRFKDILGVYLSRHPDTLNRFKSCFAETFSGFGTNEYRASKEEMILQLEKEMSLVPNESTFKISWIKEKKLGENVSIINTEYSITFNLRGKVVEINPIRTSAVFEFKDENYYLVNWHHSFPDHSRSDEVFPGSGEPKRYEEISVLFSDFVGFTNAASTIPASKLVEELNELFIKFDEIAIKHGVDKIKTIGDSYMAAAGLNESEENHAVQCVKWAKEAMEFLRERNRNSGIKWDMRVGIHTGHAVGGVVGRDKLTFDLWGDTINIAAHLEQTSEANCINVSSYTYDLVRKDFDSEYRGKVAIKGKGEMDMYFVK